MLVTSGIPRVSDLAHRHPRNPLIRPEDVPPSRPGWEVLCVFNPGAFRHEGRIGLLLRVAERPIPGPDEVTAAIVDPLTQQIVEIRVKTSDPDLVHTDPRIFHHRGVGYLTTLSHLRLAWSTDGTHFTVDPQPFAEAVGPLEGFGIEDPRVSRIDDRWLVTWSAVSACGVGVGAGETSDWSTLRRLGMIIPPHNKDCAIFEERIHGRYAALHRPSGHGLGGNDIWLGYSPDLVHWGDHHCIARTRPGSWDHARIGAGCAPIRTAAGWLCIYHGANAANRYCLGGLLLDLTDPRRVLARSAEPIMEPLSGVELEGFLSNVVFTNGHVVDGDCVTVYYGAGDRYVCSAEFSIAAILDQMEPMA